MRRGTELVAEERVLSVLAGLGVAAVAAVQVAGKVEAPVPAARCLKQVAADRPHVAELRRGGEPARVAEHCRDLWIDLELRERRARTDRPSRDPTRQHARDVDEPLGGDEALLQQRHELGAAGERAATVRECRHSLVA